MRLAVLLFAAAQTTTAGTASADQIMRTHQQTLDAGLGLKCPRGKDEEIVVCGRRRGDGPRGSEFRVPYQPEPGRRIPGEAVVDGGGCIRLCHKPVEVPLVNTTDGGAIVSIVRGIRRALED